MKGQTASFILRILLTIVVFIAVVVFILYLMGWDVWGSILDYILSLLDELKSAMTFGLWD